MPSLDPEAPTARGADVEKYRLVDCAERKPLLHGLGQVKGVFVSPVAVVVRFEIGPHCSNGNAAGSTTQPTLERVERLKSTVRPMMRAVNHQLHEHGVVCPCVALLHPVTHADASTAPSRPWFANLAWDQEWHRGEFSVFVEDSEQKADERLADLLAPKPPDVALTASAPKLRAVIEKCQASAAQSPVLARILDAWKGTLEVPPATDDRDTRSRSDPGVEAARGYLQPLFDRVDQLDRVDRLDREDD